MDIAEDCANPIHASLVHAPIGALLIDRAGVIVWANNACATLFGEADPNILRLTPIHIWLREGETLQSMIDMHFRSRPEAAMNWTRRFDIVQPDGAIHPAEITLAPINGTLADRALLFLRSIQRFVTAERRFTNLFEALPVGILIVDSQLRIVKTNKTLASEFGYACEELVGKPLATLIPQRYRADHPVHVREYMQAPSPRIMGCGGDVTGLHRSGEEFPIEIALTRHENARHPLFMAIVTDVSYRKRAEAAMQQTNAQLEEFTYVASHDLRSPLRGIADLVGWIREDLEETELSPEVQHNFDRITLRIERAEQMIDDLLKYARIGIRNPDMETIDPEQLVEEALTLTAIPDTFRVEREVCASGLRAPRAPLSTSLRNLLSNAVKHHGGESGTIAIRVSEEGRFTVFTVEDDGQGIPSGNEERIFKLFHRGSTETEGDGVGLAFTRRMINAHGGMINVTSPGTMGGARFDIYWPRILLKEFAHD